MVEDEDAHSSLTDPEIDVEDIEEGEESLHAPEKDSSSQIHRHRYPESNSTVGVRSFKEEDDVEDELLDKEELVDDEDEVPLGAVKPKKKSGKKSGKSSGSGGSGSSSSSNPQIKPKCNCDQLRLVDCHLETKELWDKFNELGTEMIITKTGRLVHNFNGYYSQPKQIGQFFKRAIYKTWIIKIILIILISVQ